MAANTNIDTHTIIVHPDHGSQGSVGIWWDGFEVGWWGVLRGGGGADRGRRGRVLLVLRVSVVLVVFLLVTTLGAETVKALPGVALVSGKEVAQVQTARSFTCGRRKTSKRGKDYKDVPFQRVYSHFSESFPISESIPISVSLSPFQRDSSCFRGRCTA